MRTAAHRASSIAGGLVIAFLLSSGTTGAAETRGAQGPAAIAAPTVPADELAAFRTRLLNATTRHLDALVEAKDGLKALRGKSAAGLTALAFYRMHEPTGKPAYRTAALQLADGILEQMRATKFGVLYIKEKEKGGGEEISGGGPPALGWYATALAYVYQRERRTADLQYVASVIDRFPWNEQGWWAATIDIRTGESKLPLTKPSPINKNAALALAAGVAGSFVKDIDPGLAGRLLSKAETNVQRQILPAQGPDGFWHYNLNGRDPKEKDVYGYFLLTGQLLLELRQFATAFREERLTAALGRAGEFARTMIAPMTEPNRGSPPRTRATAGTPVRFTLADDLKRALQLGVLLVGTKDYREAMIIVDAALARYPTGERGEEGARAVAATSLMCAMLAPDRGG